MAPSGIDKEKFLIQIERLEQNYTLLLDVKKQLGKASGDAIPLMAAERLLQILIEECLNIGNHIISGLNLERADAYKDIFVRLQQKGVISKEIGTELISFASFRNRLVHLYWRVERDEMLSKLDDIEIVKQFAEGVYTYLKSNKLL
jgi:uncharacterized protein YutE (UPF0331/DUF86 family)